MTAPAETSRIADDELLITRRFDAPASLVFRIWEHKEHRIRWWGPKDFTCTHLEQDFRPGGAWRACIVSKANGESWMSGTFREIERDRRLVFTFQWEDGPKQPGVETIVTVAWTQEDGQTVQSFHQTPFDTVQTRDSHVGGWTECIDREQDYLSQMRGEPS